MNIFGLFDYLFLFLLKMMSTRIIIKNDAKYPKKKMMQSNIEVTNRCFEKSR